jgi:hypothetical protein
MRTIILILNLVFLTAFIGCSDNLNLTDPSNQHYFADGKSNQNSSPEFNNEKAELLWQLNEFYICAVNEIKVESEEVFINQPLSWAADYLITFGAFTNAHIYTNGYYPLVKISMNNDDIFECKDFPEMNPLGISHINITLDGVILNNLTFYISLTRGSNEPGKQNSEIAKLKLSDIKVYKLN